MKFSTSDSPSFLWSLPLGLRRRIFPIFRAEEYQRLQMHRNRNVEGWFSIAPFDELQCIFVHIPKCAGKSVSNSLFGKFTGHSYLRQYEMIYSPQEFSDYYKFTFVRNPWDRIVSAFHFLKAGGLNNVDKQWSEKHLSKYDSFNDFCLDWVNSNNIQSSIFFRPQYEFFCLGSRMTPGVDFIGYFENITSDFNHVSKKLGLLVRLSHDNRSARKNDYRDYYTPTTRQIVANVYQKDIELLGYDFHNQGIQDLIAQRALEQT